MANAPEKRSYEEQWRQAFEKAEMPPSPKIWKNIDQQLTAQEGGKYKRGFFFYRAVAAGLLLCIAGLGWYIAGQQSETETIAQQRQERTESTVPPSSGQEESEATAAADAEGAQQDQSASADVTAPEELAPGIASTDRMAKEETPDKRNSPAEGALAATDATTKESARNGAAEAGKPVGTVTKTLIFPREEVSMGEEELHPNNHRVGRLAALSPDALALAPPTWIDSITQFYLVPQYREQTVPQEERKTQFFAGLTMAPSFFDPNFQSLGEANARVASDAPSQYNLDAGSAETFYNKSIATPDRTATVEQSGLNNQSTLSFSYGFDMGLSLGEHWSIESGVDYQNFQTSTETRYTVLDVQTGERYPLLASNVMANQATNANTTPIGTPEEVANTFQFVSVPVRLGYNLKFSKLMLSVGPGIAANFFLSNRISSERYASATIENDGRSPFNSQYISALISGGVFYQVLENYSISFMPSYQFAVSELTKTDASFSSQPQSIAVKLGFRYNFQ